MIGPITNKPWEFLGIYTPHTHSHPFLYHDQNTNNRYVNMSGQTSPARNAHLCFPSSTRNKMWFLFCVDTGVSSFCILFHLSKLFSVFEKKRKKKNKNFHDQHKFPGGPNKNSDNISKLIYCPQNQETILSVWTHHQTPVVGVCEIFSEKSCFESFWDVLWTFLFIGDFLNEPK